MPCKLAAWNSVCFACQGIFTGILKNDGLTALHCPSLQIACGILVDGFNNVMVLSTFSRLEIL
jgi:hypothetical protein